MSATVDRLECCDGLDLDLLGQNIIDSGLVDIKQAPDESGDIYIFDDHVDNADPIIIISSHEIQTQHFINIDGSLAKYYEQLGDKSYIRKNGNGLFAQYIIEQQLNGPIENELGDDCNPSDCQYVPFIDPSQFPIPSYLSIRGEEDKELFIFYVLQYCYKYYHPPSLEYIEKVIMPKMKLSEQTQNSKN